MIPPRILIAGIGNIFFGDDAFGTELARRLLERPWPPGVHVVDFGIRGIDLTYALLDGCEVAILLDAVSRGGTPGTLYLIEPDLDESAPAESPVATFDGHTLDPLRVLRLVREMGGRFERVLLVGCEPLRLAFGDEPGGDNPGRLGLSQPVAAALDEAERMITDLVEEFGRTASGVGR